MELWRHSALALGDLIRSGEVSSRMVVQAHLDRIADVNPDVNALVETHGDAALAAAGAADREIREGRHRGPLHGVPFTVKTNVDMAGHATTHGVVALAEARATADSPHLARLRAAGAVVIGRTNIPDYGFRWHTDNALYGSTRNPWDSGRTPGGSGGGDAAAVATGCAPLSLGGDYGGSLRFPAQACGVASLRTTVGRLPYTSATAPVELSPTLQLFTSMGPMARHVGDLRAALRAMAGYDPHDPWSLPVPLDGPPAPRRVAVTLDPAGVGTAASVVEGVRRAADALADVGYEVDEADPPAVAQAAALWLATVAAEARLNPPQWRESMSEQSQAFVEAFLQVAPELDLGRYAFLLADRARVAREWALFQQRYPVVLGPVMTCEPFQVGADLAGPVAVAELVAAARFMVAVNALGLPAAVVPVGVSRGLPQAVQLVGARFREDLCLDAAQAIEDRLGLLTPIAPRAAAMAAA